MFGPFLSRHTLRGHVIQQYRQIDIPLPGPQTTCRAGLFSQLAFGHSYHRYFGNRRMAEERRLDLRRVDVEAAADDLVLDPADHADEAVGITDDLVAGQIEAVCSHPLLSRAQPFRIAKEKRGPAHTGLPAFTA